MKDNRPVRIPVYLSCRVVKDCSGSEITFPERRLVRQGPEDRVLAIIAAPLGSRVRRREDQHGHDHLVVPRGRSLWARLFGRQDSIPAKYVIGDARSRAYGLAIADDEPPRPRPVEEARAIVEPGPLEVKG